MSAPKEHHYVPQFYFRNFSSDPKRRSIHLLLKATRNIVLNASIKSQSKRGKLYLDTEIERALSNVEAGVSECFKTLIERFGSYSSFRRCESIHYPAVGGLLLQLARLPQRGERWHRAMSPLFQTAMSIELSKCPEIPETVRDGLESGELFVFYDSRYDVLQLVQMALLAPPLLFDMTMLLIVNVTEVPFVFSDAPAIATNRFLWEYREMTGIAGLGSRGLIAFMPLCEYLAVMFFDGGAYSCSENIDHPIYFNSDSDVGLMNAFQARSAHDVIYFGSSSAAEYVQRLHSAHEGSMQSDRFVVRRAQSTDGRSELVHYFERVLPISADFSFLQVRREPTTDDLRLPRNKELTKRTEEMWRASIAPDGNFTRECFETTIEDLFQKTAELRERC